MKALVVEDTPDLQDLLKTILESFGIQVHCAANGEEGLSVLKSKGPFDFCTVDIYMPVMNGFDFVAAVRQDPFYNGMRLLMVTTDIEKSSITKALRSGADEYLMKPYTKDMVEGKLKIMGFL
jgi:two-component system, chemotaxis family, chemotaxis protein CheY